MPVCCLVVRLVLTYRAVSVDPSLADYYPELLAVVFLTLAFYRLSSFAFRAGRTRRFALYAALAIAFCLAALADRPDPARLLFYLGGALTLFGFLLQRAAALAAPGTRLTVYHKIPAERHLLRRGFSVCLQIPAPAPPPEREQGQPGGWPCSLFFGRLDEKKFCLLQVLRY